MDLEESYITFNWWLAWWSKTIKTTMKWNTLMCVWGEMSLQSFQVCPTLWNPMDYSLPPGLLCPWGFSRQEYCSGLPCPFPGDLPDLGIEPVSLTSPALAGGFFTTSTTWEALNKVTYVFQFIWWFSPAGSEEKESTCNTGTQVWSLDQDDPLEKGKATHSSIPAWRIPWTEEPGWLQSMGLQRVGHNWETNTT